jgi:hypothetical protein
MNFWIQFAITEALSVVNAFLQSTSALTPAQKSAAQNLITAGEAFLATL